MAWYNELTEAELTTLKENLLTEINNILTVGQDVSVEARRKMRAQLPQVRETLKEVCLALQNKSNSGGIKPQRIVPVI